MYKILAINCGSSSLKFKLFDMPEDKVLCSGIAEKIGLKEGAFEIKWNNQKDSKNLKIDDHGVAVKLLLDELLEKEIIHSFDEIVAIGHRVLTGGNKYPDSVLFNEDVEKTIEELIPFAPLHNPANLVGYRAFKKILPNCPQVAVFDTSFHQTLEAEDYLFPIPYKYYSEYGIRRYGAHGTSHKFLAKEGARLLNNPEHCNIITCHIGNGASISAVRDGNCVATSMGLTPLGGVMMGTRCGDLDPSVLQLCCDFENKDYNEMINIFNKKSGLLGVSGVSNDSREVLAAIASGNTQAETAYKLFARTISNYIGQYFVRLGHVDLIIFAGGIGENSYESRSLIINNVKEAMNIEIDEELNKSVRGKEVILSTDASKVKVCIIPTDEELMIATDAMHIGLGK